MCSPNLFAVLFVAGVIILMVVVHFGTECVLYEKWKAAYVPTLAELECVTARMRYLYELPKPSGEQLAEFVACKRRSNELITALNQLQTLNPRRKHRKN